MVINLDALPTQRCDECTLTLEHLVAVDAGKGGIQYKPVCPVCGRRGSAIKHDLLKRMGIDTAAVEIICNRACRCARGCSQCSPACEWPDCGTHEMTELHHYFPRSIYGTEFADRGHMAYFCQTHHHGWHVAVTPHLVSWRAA